MTQDNDIERRAFMGMLAALSAGKAMGVTAASNGQDGEGEVSTNSDHLGDYANRAGRINHEGFQQAVNDLNNGTITSSEFDQVKQAFATGQRVVNKTVQTIDSDFNSSTILEKNPNNSGGEAIVYQFDGSIGVNADVEIQDGVVMEFTQGSSLNVNSGPLRMKGTSNEGIFVTGTAAKQGWWNGIYIDSTDLQNTMEHVLVEYGGRGSYRGCLDIASDGTDSGKIAVTNCTLRWSGEYGLYQGNSAELLDEGNNVYANNRESGVRTLTSRVHEHSASSSYTDNDRNYVFVEANTASDAGPDEETRIWNKLEVPYRMQGQHNVNSLTLQIEAGTELEFTQQSWLQFDSSARISIEGADGSPVVFTGATKQRGWWDGVYINDTTDTENIFNYCTFEYAANNFGAALDVASGGTDSGSVELTNCTFRENDGFGLIAGNSSTLINCENNTYTSNTDGAARIGTENMQSLSSTSDFTGNDNDYVLVDPRGVSGAGRDSDARTWDAINVPYRMNGTHDVNNLELSIEPGATLEFTEAAQMNFNGGARLSISGFIDDTETEDVITFTGTKKQRGWWRGIYINDTTDQENEIEYVTLEYAGAEGWTGGLDVASGGTDSGYLQFNNCTFRNCAQYGVKVGGSATIENLSSNTYTLNGEGAMNIKTDDMESLNANSDFTGNDKDFVRVENSNINGNGPGSDSRTWDAIDVPYRLEGNHGIDNVELTVEAGTSLEFTEAAGLNFNPSSVFILSGEGGNPITFTGSENTRGWWNGVYINDTESRKNRLEYVVMEYAGNNQDGQLNIASGGTDSGQIEKIANCTFRNGEGYGIQFGGRATVRNMSNNTYTNNTEGAVLTRTGNIHELNGNSDFTGNDTDRVMVKATSLNSTLDGSATWDALNVPYEMQNTTHGVEGVELDIEAGARFEFQEEARLQFNNNATIQMNGASGNEIVLTATQDGRDLKIKGWWYGIYMHKSTSKTNTMDYVTVEWAGRGPSPSVNIARGGTDNGYLALENCTIRKSGGVGLYAQNASSTNSDVCNLNTFEDNNGQDCFIDN